MTVDYSERNFEQTIEAALLAGGPDSMGPAPRGVAEGKGPFTPGGYRKRRSEDYDRARCLLSKDLLDFVYATQPKTWEKFKALHGEEAKDRFLDRVADQVTRHGTLEVLRKGVKSDGSRFDLAYFRPASGLNEETERLHRGNVFSVARQLHFSQGSEKSVDVALFVNGLPLFTAELKNPLMGQDVNDAVRQYRVDRDPREPLFSFGRCLAHFALDPEYAFVTTHLQGPTKTKFLPFNQGYNQGAGNPPALESFSTAYLWEEVWAKDSVLDLVQNFCQVVEIEDDKGRKTGERRLLFPRYHQLDAVRRLVADARTKGPAQRYLIQHSAGSGKSNSIAWLAHQLSSLHDAEDKRVFDSIVVITDRRVLDRQLQRTVRQFEQVEGVVENIDQTSRQLKEALESGKTIIVTTLQKFPVIVKDIGELPGKRFAIIVDEAHSSQTGESTKSLKAVLSAKSLETAERQDQSEEDDLEDRIVAEMKKRGRQKNVSVFAFTATPKPKTMELFGAKQPDGTFLPFSLYSMRQAIEEGFILDVLDNYTTYRTYWNLLKKVEDDPRYDRRMATFLLKSFVDLHDHAIRKKVEIMVEHFATRAASRIRGTAKAMIVTRSRLHAVRFKLALDEVMKERGHPFKALVAFSGVVKDGGKNYTEAGMNGVPETQTALTFHREEFRFLVVANKFQTGFDEPLLHTMYVDRKLGGVGAVQTLSRLNRTHSDKDETMVLDFANEAGAIKKAFEPYYDRTILTEGTDPNLLYDLETRLAAFGLFGPEDVERYAQVYFSAKGTQEGLHSALRPVVDRYLAAPEDQRSEFLGALREFVRLYSFLSQVIAFADSGMEKLYEFCRLLLRKLPVAKARLPLEVQRQIDIESYRLEKTTSGKIGLDRGKGRIEPRKAKGGFATPGEEVDSLSAIIRELNERFGTSFTEEDRVFIEQLEARLAGDEGLAASVRVNPKVNARLTFDHVVEDKLQDLMNSNFKFYRQLTDNPEFAKLFFDWIFDRYLAKAKGRPTRGEEE